MFKKASKDKKKDKKGKKGQEQVKQEQNYSDKHQARDVFFDPQKVKQYNKDELASGKQQINQKNEKVTKLLQELEALQIYKQHCQNLQQMLQTQVLETQQKQKQNQALKAGLEEAGIDINFTDDTKQTKKEGKSQSNLQASTSLLKKEMEQLNHKLMESIKKQKEFQVECAQAKETIKKKEQLISEFYTKLQDLMDQKGELMEQVQKLQSSAQNQNNKIQFEKQDLLHEIQEKEHFINVLKNDKGDLTRQNQSLSNTIDFLSGKKQQLEEQIKRMQDEKNRDSHPLFERASIDAVSSRSAKKSNRIILSNPSVGDELQTHDDDETPRNPYNDEQQHIEQIQFLESQIQEKNSQIGILRKGLNEVEEQHSKVKTQIVRVIQEKQKEIADRQQLQKSNQNLNKKLQIADKKIAELQIKRRTANQQLLKYQGIVDKMKKNGGGAAIDSTMPTPQYGVQLLNNGGRAGQQIPNSLSPSNLKGLESSFSPGPSLGDADPREVLSLPPPMPLDRNFMGDIKGSIQNLYKELMSFIFQDTSNPKSKQIICHIVYIGQSDAINLQRKLMSIIVNMREYLQDNDNDQVQSNMSGASAPRGISPRYSLGFKNREPKTADSIIGANPPPKIFNQSSTSNTSTNRSTKEKIVAAFKTIKNTPSRMIACIRPSSKDQLPDDVRVYRPQKRPKFSNQIRPSSSSNKLPPRPKKNM